MRRKACLKYRFPTQFSARRIVGLAPGRRLGAAIWITSHMGWRNAYGEMLGLKTTGWFAWSRNPIYVVTWAGLVGWALTANSLLVTIIPAIWALLYFIASFLEEPWLERQYGEEYRGYRSRVPRVF